MDPSGTPYGENYDPLFPDQPVVDQSLQVWARHGAFADKTAFTWTDKAGNEVQSLTFAELNTSATVIAAELLHRFHLSHGDRVVAVFPPTGLEFIELLFGSQRAGLVLIPISPPDSSPSNREENHNLLQRMNSLAPKLILAPPEYCAEFNRFLRKYRAQYGFVNMLNLPLTCTSLSHPNKRGFGFSGRYSNDLETEKLTSIASGQHGCTTEDVYLLQYSSGTTGAPKAAIITAGAAAHNVRAVRRAYNLQPSSIMMSWLPLYHDCGLMLVLCSVVSGCSMVVTSPFYFIERPLMWLELVSTFKATATAVPAFVLPLTCARFESSTCTRLDLSALETVMVMNEPVLATVVSDFLKTFEAYGLKPGALAPSYGLAEMCTFVSTLWERDATSLPVSNTIVACGRVSKSSEFDIRIVDPETCMEANEDEEGEIWIASASKAVGYLDDEELSERDLRATLSRSSSKFVRTGDLGRVSNGFLFVTGRVADLIVADGCSWHPHEIEKTVFESSSDLLRSGCAVAFSLNPRPRSRDMIGIKPFVVILAELKSTASDEYRHRATLIEIIRLNLSLNHQGFEASVIGLLPPKTIPKTTSGKLRRNECRNRFIAHKFRFVNIYHGTPCNRTSAL